MCGRASLAVPWSVLKDRFDLEPDPWRASRTTDSELHWEITTTAFDRAYKWTDGAFRPCGHASTAQQRLVRMLTGIGADVERYLESENPYEQAWILYERLYKTQREWAGEE